MKLTIMFWLIKTMNSADKTSLAGHDLDTQSLETRME